MPVDAPPRAAPSVVRQTLLFSLAILALLQAWRPHFFLSDDNLCGWGPVVSEVGRALWRGDSPMWNPFLWGGTDLARDPANLCLWHPALLLLSLLAPTPLGIWIPDLSVSLNLLLCAFAMSHLMLRLREIQQPDLSDRRAILLSLSFTFSAYALITTPSWATFAANIAALPVLMLGLLHPRRRAGIFLVAGATLHTLLGGHLSPFVFSFVFVAIFLAVYCIGARTPEPPLRLAIGTVAAVAMISPLLVPAARGFLETPRAGEQGAAFASQLHVPWLVQAGSFFGGKLGVLFESDAPGAIPSGIVHIASCTAAWAAFHSIGARRKMSALERAALCAALASVVFVARPAWLSQILSEIPLLRSLRVPMREVVFGVFFVHVWMALRPVALAPAVRRATLAVGATLFVASLLSQGPPSFSDMELDRRLVLSGQAARHWDALRPEISSRDGFVAVLEAPVPLVNANLDRVPWSLLGAYNYPAMFGVRSQAGYFIPGLRAASGRRARPFSAVMGVFPMAQARLLQKQKPGLRILSLTSLDPVRIELVDGDKRRALKLPALDYPVGPLKPAWSKAQQAEVEARK